MKNIEIKNLYEALLKFSEVETRRPFKIDFAVQKNIRLIAPHYADYDKARVELCSKYAKKDEKGKPVMKGENGKNEFDMEDMEGFTKEFQELSLLETEVTLHKIKIDDLANLEFTKEEKEKSVYTLSYYLVNE